jgi:hypothetical protein
MSDQTHRLMAVQLENTSAWVRDALLELSQRLDDIEHQLRWPSEPPWARDLRASVALLGEKGQ